MSAVNQARRSGAGYSIPAAAAEIGFSYRTFLAAVENGEVRVIKFGGLRRVPSGEVERLKALFAGQAQA